MHPSLHQFKNKQKDSEEMKKKSWSRGVCLGLSLYLEQTCALSSFIINGLSHSFF